MPDWIAYVKVLMVLLLQGRTPPTIGPGTFLAAWISWVVVPAVALLIGGVLLQWFYNNREHNN